MLDILEMSILLIITIVIIVPDCSSLESQIFLRKCVSVKFLSGVGFPEMSIKLKLCMASLFLVGSFSFLFYPCTHTGFHVNIWFTKLSKFYPKQSFLISLSHKNMWKPYSKLRGFVAIFLYTLAYQMVLKYMTIVW